MRKFGMMALGMMVMLGGCSAAQMTTASTQAIAAAGTPAGQLFCAFQQMGGGTAVVALINAEVAGTVPGATPAAVIATGASKVFVDAACQQAALASGATGGMPVSPPATLAAQAAAPLIAVAVSKVIASTPGAVAGTAPTP